MTNSRRDPIVIRYGSRVLPNEIGSRSARATIASTPLIDAVATWQTPDDNLQDVLCGAPLMSVRSD